MPELSAFTPCGILELSSEPSVAETIYDSLVASLGGDGTNYTIQPGSRQDAWCYAMAMALATARLTLIHAGKQIEADCVAEFMADRETEWQITPGPNDTLIQRRNVLGARKLLPRGARREAVIDALTKLLGTAFLFYRTTKPAEIVTWPATASSQPINFQLPTVPRKLIKITQPISVNLGTPQAVTYSLFDSGEPVPLVGDVFVIEPDMLHRAEAVTITAVGTGTITATFANPHNLGCLATTMPFPAWNSTQRENMVVTTAAAANDPETRRKVNELLERLIRGISTWSIVETTGTGVAGPFKLGVSPLGATPLGTVNYP